MAMRIVRKLSPKRYYGKVFNEYERFLIPIPAKTREIVHRWVGRDQKAQVEPFLDTACSLWQPALDEAGDREKIEGARQK